MATPKEFGFPWPEFNDGLFYHDVVSSSDAHPGLTLIQFYSTKYNTSAPLQGWLQRIQSEQITVDGQIVTDPNTVLRVGSKLVYHRLPWKEPDAPCTIEVLYEDDDMIALNKPSGLQVLPGGLFQQRTVLTQLQWKANNQGTFKTHQTPHPVPVHRLGRGTSGILLCAKTKLARARLASYFADGTSHIGEKRDTNQELGKIAKIYRALASGIVDNDKLLFIANDSKTRWLELVPIAYDEAEKSKHTQSSQKLMKLINGRLVYNYDIDVRKIHVRKIQKRMVDEQGLIQQWDPGGTPYLQHKLKIALTVNKQGNKVTINQPIGMVKYPGVAKGLYVASQSGKPALSLVDILERNLQENNTLVQVKIQSGRPHQIRIHLSFIGHPLLGDPLYGVDGKPKCLDCDFIDDSFAEDGGYQRPMKPVPGDCGYYLHAHKLVISHPITNEVIEIVAPVPSILLTTVEAKEIATVQQTA